MDLLTAVAVSMLPLSRGRASAWFKELRQHASGVSLSDLLGRVGFLDDTVETEAFRAAEAAIAAAPALGIEPVPWFDERYSALLNCIIDPPPVLWIRGDVVLLSRPAVAIVGSRAASPYALDVGARLAGELAERGMVVVSGLARGVDSAAHKGCLAAGGQTIAVLGSGLDRIYPAEHEPLAADVASQGLLLSELGPGAYPRPEHFPLRNRIISGLSLGVVVVEANEKSGSLITARCATEQGRDVMAVPGSVLSGRNRGSHRLLKDGAMVVETAVDILDGLGWPGAAFGTDVNRQGADGDSADRQPRIQDPILAAMEAGEVYELDQLVEATGMAAPRILTRLMELELEGRIAATGRGRFSRRPPTG